MPQPGMAPGTDVEATVLQGGTGPGGAGPSPAGLGVPGSAGDPPVAPDPMVGKIMHHFRVLEPIGQGGMGRVYRAHDLSLDRPVALKVIASEVSQDATQRERFIREARAQARLSHPNVVGIYYIGEQEEQLFFAMELVEGDALDARLRQGHAMPWGDAIEVAIRVAEALDQASRQGIVHRDVKPSNLILDPAVKVKVADFGLAKAAYGSSGGASGGASGSASGGVSGSADPALAITAADSGPWVPVGGGGAAPSAAGSSSGGGTFVPGSRARSSTSAPGAGGVGSAGSGAGGVGSAGSGAGGAGSALGSPRSPGSALGSPGSPGSAFGSPGSPGLAADADLTRVGAVIGSPLYLSPEQAQGLAADHRSDIYSLGATLFHLITGRPVFEGPNARAVMAMHIATPAPALRDRQASGAAQVPPRVESLLARMLAKDPAARFGTWGELLGALRAARPQAVAPAGFVVRAIAYGIDFGLAAIPIAVLGPAGVLLAALYFVLQWRLWGGRTVGKWIFRLRVRTAHNEPVGFWRAVHRVLWLHWGWVIWTLVLIAAMFAFDNPELDLLDDSLEPRWVAGLFIGVDALAMTLYVLGLLWAALGRSKRALHDRICKTRVVYDLPGAREVGGPDSVVPGRGMG